jgi:hypothetical protein
MLYIALEIPLRLLAVGRRGQGGYTGDAWAETFGDALDGTALAGRVASFEEHDDFQFFEFDPFLQFDQFDLQFGQTFFIELGFQRWLALGMLRGCRILVLTGAFAIAVFPFAAFRVLALGGILFAGAGVTEAAGFAAAERVVAGLLAVFAAGFSGALFGASVLWAGFAAVTGPSVSGLAGSLTSSAVVLISLMGAS